MKAQIIQIGNSSGVILPKSILADFQLKPKSAVSIIEVDGSIVIKPEPRAGWREAFTAYAQQGEERLMPDLFEDENNSFWEWK